MWSLNKSFYVLEIWLKILLYLILAKAETTRKILNVKKSNVQVSRDQSFEKMAQFHIFQSEPVILKSFHQIQFLMIRFMKLVADQKNFYLNL